jgi:hypothetical protein
MSGLITDKDEQAWNDNENQLDDYSDNDRRQAFFIAHHQMMAYHHVVGCLDMYRTKVLLYRTMVLMACLTKVRR